MNEVRLIDANALEIAIKAQQVIDREINPNIATISYHNLSNIINNAPTVEPKLKDDIIEAFNQITDQEFEHTDTFWIETPKGKKIEFEKKRPQGEWIIDEDTIFGIYGNYRKCSICNENAEWLDGGSQFLSNYCPNCGASMKGGAE